MLCDKFGVRRMVIAGGLLACVGWTSSAFANGLPYLYFSLGIIAGISVTFNVTYVDYCKATPQNDKNVKIMHQNNMGHPI